MSSRPCYIPERGWVRSTSRSASSISNSLQLRPQPRAQTRIPTGFRPKARGCEARATLGQTPQRMSTPTGLCPSFLPRRSNPVGVEAHPNISTLVLFPFHEPPRSADILVCGFTGHSCPVSLACEELATGKSPEPAGWKACATSRFRATRRESGSGESFHESDRCCVRSTSRNVPERSNLLRLGLRPQPRSNPRRFMVPMRDTRIMEAFHEPQRRAGVSPARVGEADGLLALTRSLGRRDCPTLPASTVQAFNARNTFSGKSPGREAQG